MFGSHRVLDDCFCYESENEDKEILKKFISAKQHMIELFQKEIEFYKREQQWYKQEIYNAKKQFNHMISKVYEKLESEEEEEDICP